MIRLRNGLRGGKVGKEKGRRAACGAGSGFSNRVRGTEPTGSATRVEVEGSEVRGGSNRSSYISRSKKGSGCRCATG